MGRPGRNTWLNWYVEWTYSSYRHSMFDGGYVVAARDCESEERFVGGELG